MRTLGILHAKVLCAFQLRLTAAQGHILSGIDPSIYHSQEGANATALFGTKVDGQMELLPITVAFIVR